VDYKELRFWQKALDLADMIYNEVGGFPKEETFGLTSQIKRAAISVMSNIAEGSARGTTKEYLRFLSMAKGSLKEVEAQLIFAERRKFISESSLEKYMSETNSIGKMITKMQQSLREKL